MENVYTGPRTGYAVAEAQSAFLRSVFAWMTAGLGVTWVTSVWVLSSTQLAAAVLRPGVLIVLAIVELGLVFWLSARVQRMSTTAATASFLLYSALNGVTLTPLAFVYTSESIASVFLITAATFASMAFLGAVSKINLSGVGSFAMMGLWGVVIASIVNIFLGSDLVSFAISVAGVIVFTGLTAWNVQQLKQVGATVEGGTAAFRQQAIIGALALYLDFINLFISLLRLLGRRE